MARSVIVAKKCVTTQQSGLFSITLNMQYKENETVLINQDFTENHWLGKPPTEALARMKEKMQELIDEYKASELVFNAAALNAAITALQDGLVV